MSLKLPSLSAFWTNPKLRNSDLREPGWKRLYVRKGSIYLDLPECGFVKLDAVLQLVNVTATKPRHGSFTALVAKAETLPGLQGIYVENVHNAGFASSLPGHGFTALCAAYPLIPPCFYKAVGTSIT